MPDGFYLGATYAILFVGAGIALGLWLGRRLPAERSAEAADLEPMVNGLMRFTDDFSRDVSEYRSLIDAAARRAQELSGGQAADGTFLSQIIEANELLQRRLEEAECTLQTQSEEINSFMTEARTDVLTSLPNRRAFDDELTRRLALHERQQTPCAVLLVDVDRFKSVNDRFGHQVGDEVLKVVADSLRRGARGSDLVARYGGEEFAVLLSGTSMEEFQSAAERMRKMVEETPIAINDGTLQATVSCGVASALSEEDGASLIRRADEALYASKSGGRNCSYWHDGRRATRITPAMKATVASTPAPASSESFREVCAELRRKLLEITK